MFKLIKLFVNIRVNRLLRIQKRPANKLPVFFVCLINFN